MDAPEFYRQLLGQLGHHQHTQKFSHDAALQHPSVTGGSFQPARFKAHTRGLTASISAARRTVKRGLAAAGISNLYYPASSRNGAGLTFENAAIGTAATAAANLLQEFVVRKLTPKLPKYASP